MHQITVRGYPVREVSDRLGVSTYSLYKWMKLYAKTASKASSVDHEAEIRRLKRELAGFWPLSRTFNMPLCVDRTVVEVSATGCRVAPDFSGDRAGRSPELPGDGTDTCTPCALQSYFLTFCEGKATVLQ